MKPDYVLEYHGVIYLIGALGETSTEKLIHAATSACHPSRFNLDGYTVALSTEDWNLYQKVA